MPIAMGDRAHIQVRPQVKAQLTRFFAEALGCGAPVVMDTPGLAEPILAFRFPGGGSVSFEFSPDAPDERQARRGAWLEVRTDDTELLIARVLNAGVERIRHPATPTFYFVAPGGQVFGIVQQPRA